jgi:hypothetical protein
MISSRPSTAGQCPFSGAAGLEALLPTFASQMIKRPAAALTQKTAAPISVKYGFMLAARSIAARMK